MVELGYQIPLVLDVSRWITGPQLDIRIISSIGYRDGHASLFRLQSRGRYLDYCRKSPPLLLIIITGLT